MDIGEYCLSKKQAYEDHPFGEIPICYRVKGKIFAQLYPNEWDYKITLRCEPEYGQFLRQLRPGVIARGYHCPPMQQPYFNTVLLQEFEDDKLLLDMIDHSYEECVKRLTKRVQKELMEE